MKRFATSVVSFVFAVTTCVVIPFASPVYAATSGWSRDTTAVGSDYIQSTPGGNVVASNCSQAPTAMRTFSPTGGILANVPQRTDGVYAQSCYGHGAIGKDGVVFGVATNSSTKYAVVAYRGNTKLWERSFLYYCFDFRQTIERAINSVLVGGDGFLYVVNMPHTCTGDTYVSKLNAGTGQVVFEKQFAFSPMFVEATSSGLVMQDSRRVIRYLKYDGTEFASPVTAAGWLQAVDMSGRAFTVDALTDSCSTGVLKMYTPGVAAPFGFTVPQCWRIQRVVATSRGGLAMLAYNQYGKPTLTSYKPNTSGGFNAASIILPDTDGYRSFKADYNYGPFYYSIRVQPDVNGNILLVREYQWQRGSNSLRGWQFTLLAGSLNVVSEYDTSAFDFQQTNRFARGVTWALAKDRLYVSIGYCTSVDPYQCGTRTVSLYAVRLARLGADYPRGTVLGVMPTVSVCKSITFVGVRGSGEDPFAYEGLGQTVQHVKDRLIAEGLTNMEVIAVAYPATPVAFTSASYPADYRDSVTDGIDAVNATLIQINRDCPLTKIILFAYSQGAHATDGVRFLPVGIQNQIKAMGLLGDPLFNPALTSVNKGTFNASLSGIWVSPIGPHALPARQFSTVMLGKIVSYCIADDPICNLDYVDAVACQANAIKCPHGLYRPDWTQQAATWAKGKVTA